MDTGKKIFMLRDSKGWTQRQLAAKVGLGQGAISDIEKGKREPNQTLINKFSQVFEVTTDYLLRPDKDYFPPRNGDTIRPESVPKETDQPQSAETARLLYFDHIIAGEPADSVQESLGEHYVSGHLWGPKRYVLRVEDDSMYPKLQEGDLILVDKVDGGSPASYSGKICTVLYRGKSMLKRITVNAEGEVQLKPDNPYLPAITVSSTDELVIQGWVVALVERRNL